MSGCRVVLIEDNPADVFLIKLALKENNVVCELTVFPNGHDALNALCPDRGTEGTAVTGLVPDVILLDLNTPKSDGFEVLLRLRGSPHLSDARIAILTSSQASSDKARSIRLGAMRYIQKPSQLDEFLSTVGPAVREMLASENPAERPAVPS